MNASNHLFQQLQRSREDWIEIEPGLRLKVRRPTETGLAPFYNGVTVDLLCEALVDWEGFTSDKLLPAGLGSSDPLPFDADLAKEVISDRADWAATAAAGLVDLIAKHVDRRKLEKKS
jgi:hypothetical protein